MVLISKFKLRGSGAEFVFKIYFGLKCTECIDILDNIVIKFKHILGYILNLNC